MSTCPIDLLIMQIRTLNQDLQVYSMKLKYVKTDYIGILLT